VVKPPTVLNRFLGSVAVVGLAVLEVEVGRVVALLAVDVEGAVLVRLAGVVDEVNLPTGLLVEVAVRAVVVAGFLSAVGPATLDLRSIEDEVGLRGARVDVVPAMDMRFAVPEIPRFSSPELATDRGFSSAELLTDMRDRWDEVVEVLSGFRVDVVVAGRVGGLFSVLVVRVVPVVGFDADEEVGRLVAVPDIGRFAVPSVPGLALFGEAIGLSLDTSGLDLTISSPPETTLDSTGVAGGSFSSTSSRAGGSSKAGASTGAGATTDSSFDDISANCLVLKCYKPSFSGKVQSARNGQCLYEGRVSIA
jgi:hypothetical protein